MHSLSKYFEISPLCYLPFFEVWFTGTTRFDIDFKHGRLNFTTFFNIRPYSRADSLWRMEGKTALKNCQFDPLAKKTPNIVVKCYSPGPWVKIICNYVTFNFFQIYIYTELNWLIGVSYAARNKDGRTTQHLYLVVPYKSVPASKFLNSPFA